MTAPAAIEFFLVAAPGLEQALGMEARALGFKSAKVIKGGVTIAGSWKDVWRANLMSRGATRIIARIATFRAFHLAQLDKRARRVAWGDVLRADVPVHVEAACSSSKIYHSGATAQRIARAIHEELGCPISEDAEVVIKVRIEDDLCTIGVDTSGAPLHKRGHKEQVNKAPMRETMAYLFLRLCGYDGTEPVVDPMCGSGTFVIEAAEIAAGLNPGRSRHFAFEKLATFNAAAWKDMQTTAVPRAITGFKFHGSDRDAGAIAMSRANAERAGVIDFTEFAQHAISELVRPPGPPGLVIVNPPYGSRIGEKQQLTALYRALGRTLMERFSG